MLWVMASIFEPLEIYQAVDADFWTETEKRGVGPSTQGVRLISGLHAGHAFLDANNIFWPRYLQFPVHNINSTGISLNHMGFLITLCVRPSLTIKVL